MTDSVYTTTTLVIHQSDHYVVSELPYCVSFSPILPSGVTLDVAVTPTATVSPDNQLAVVDLAVNSSQITDNNGTIVAIEKGVVFTFTPDTGVAGVTYNVKLQATTDGGSILNVIVPVYVQG